MNSVSVTSHQRKDWGLRTWMHLFDLAVGHPSWRHVLKSSCQTNRWQKLSVRTSVMRQTWHIFRNVPVWICPPGNNLSTVPFTPNVCSATDSLRLLELVCQCIIKSPSDPFWWAIRLTNTKINSNLFKREGQYSLDERNVRKKKKTYRKLFANMAHGLTTD